MLLRKADRLSDLSIAYNVLEPRPLRRIARALSACAPLPGVLHSVSAQSLLRTADFLGAEQRIL